MKRNFKLKPCFIYSSVIFLCFWMMVNVNSAYAKWHFGIGTGFSQVAYEGDMGFDTISSGPVTHDIDLDPDDLSDLMESAFGFAGYATEGTWMIQYSVGHLALEGDSSRVLSSGETVYSDIEFDKNSAQVTVGYLLESNLPFSTSVYLGLRYLNHDISSDSLIVNGGTIALSRDMDHEWTDILIGFTVNVPINDEWSWNNNFNAGFGGSEGTYFVSSGLSWRFHQSWSTSLSANYLAIEYENDDEGDADWYLYDMDEYGVGLSFLFHW